MDKKPDKPEAPDPGKAEKAEKAGKPEKPQRPVQLSFFFYEPLKERLKGTIYFDNSTKGSTKFKWLRHNTYLAEVIYNGVKYRKRSVKRADCERFLEEMADKYDKGLLE